MDKDKRIESVLTLIAEKRKELAKLEKFVKHEFTTPIGAFKFFSSSLNLINLNVADEETLAEALMFIRLKEKSSDTHLGKPCNEWVKDISVLQTKLTVRQKKNELTSMENSIKDKFSEDKKLENLLSNIEEKLKN